MPMDFVSYDGAANRFRILSTLANAMSAAKKAQNSTQTDQLLSRLRDKPRIPGAGSGGRPERRIRIKCGKSAPKGRPKLPGQSPVRPIQVTASCYLFTKVLYA